MLKKPLVIVIFMLMAEMVGAYCTLGMTDCSSFSLAPSLGYYKYAEPGLMNIKGISFGLQADYQYTSAEKVAFIFASEIAFVNGRYAGSYQNGTPLSYNNDNSYLLSFSPRIGYQLYFARQDLQLVPFIGIAYRYLNNDNADKPGGYLREANYFYIPVGITVDKRFSKWLFESNFEFDYFVYGRQYSGIDGGIENAQHSGYGAKLNALVGQADASVTWLAGPYIKYWNIKDSETATGASQSTWIEPANYTVDSGLMVKFVF